MTRHVRASYHQCVLEMVNMDSSKSNSHKDLRASQITQSEEDTCRVMQAIDNFINPFQVESKDVLYCLSSGAPAPSDVEKDLLEADQRGKEAYREFIGERLIERNKSFHDPIKKVKLKAFASVAKSVKVTEQSKKTKQITAERNVFGQLILLAIENQISMERMLSFPLGPVPWALATADGIPAKTDKSKLMHALEDNAITAQKSSPATTAYIIDGNALLQAQMSLPNTFGELSESIFAQLPNVRRVDFVTDSYHPFSIKGLERAQRGTAKPHLIQGRKTKIPRDWKQFMSSDKNKQRLISFLIGEWKTDK